MPTKLNNTMQRRDFCKGVAATTAILPTALVAEAIEPKFVSWAPGRRGFCRVTTTSRPASVQKPVFA